MSEVASIVPAFRASLFLLYMSNWNSFCDNLRQRLLDALDASEYRPEIFVGEPENTKTGGTAHTIVFRSVTIRLDFGGYTCSIEVKDPEGAFAERLTRNDGRRGFLVGAHDLGGSPVSDVNIPMIKYGTCWSYLMVMEVETRLFEAVFRAALELALA